MKKLLSLVMALILTLGALCLVGCGGNGTGKDTDTDVDTTVDTSNSDSDLAYVTGKGELIIGITDFEPMDFQDEEGNWIGFDAEVAKAVCEKLGVTPVFQEIQWSAKETELAAKYIDCIWNGLTVDEERAANMSLTQNYMINKQVIVIRTADAEKFATVEALAGATIAAEAGSAGESVINEKFADCTYIEKEGMIDALTEIKSMTVDAAILDYTMANYLINKEGSDFGDLTILDAEISAEEFYAVAFRKGSDITAKVNEALTELTEDGTIATIAAKYGLADTIVTND